jgi:acylphosphatase
MANTTARLSATITGQVQGVSFRYYTQAQAQQLGLTGWVKNLPNGAVAVWAEGPRADLEKLLAWLQHGPPTAHVHTVQAEWGVGVAEDAATYAHPHFEVRY